MDDDERRQVSPKIENNLFSLAGQVAVVTGGAGLLGQVFCQALATAGANVAVIDIDKPAAESIAAKIDREKSQKVLAIECDITSPQSVSTMVQKVVAEFGRIDVLLNNAASKGSNLDQFFAPFENYSLQAWREVTAVNIDGLFLVAQSVGNQMKKQGSGSIIQISSIYGVVAPDQRIYAGSEYNGRAINTPAVYSVSKAAVIGLTSYLSTYWADSKIRVNTLTPGGISSGQNDEFNKKYSQRVPLGRMGEASELTGALIYLASDASSYVTGQNIIVDGGLSAW
ncbi:MAG: SDR family oxidoreductase [Actinobacteria bacterium]|nr:SDR family oxidoreductase [Actinomycetota bacterium]